MIREAEAADTPPGVVMIMRVMMGRRRTIIMGMVTSDVMCDDGDDDGPPLGPHTVSFCVILACIPAKLATVCCE